MAGDVGECGDVEEDGGGAAGSFVELCQFFGGRGEADTQAFGFAEPAVLLGLGDALGEVLATGIRKLTDIAPTGAPRRDCGITAVGSSGRFPSAV
ncbi:hypothetical protein AB0M45_32225 [Nocardia sp. NPDC051787]|uniref:hypothetical protein n=1 Tax=Nocardia sp. NPDC051787 TaxID=3155415 RepID=UPI003422EAE4